MAYEDAGVSVRGKSQFYMKKRYEETYQTDIEDELV